MNAADDTQDQDFRTLRSEEQARQPISFPENPDNPEAASGARTSSSSRPPVASPRCHIVFLIRGPEFFTWNWSWQYLVPLLKLEYHSLCIYMYVLSNPPPVSIVYFFLLFKEMVR